MIRSRLTLSLAGLMLAVSLAAAVPAAAGGKKTEAGPAAFVDLSLVLGAYRKTAAFGKYRDRITKQAEAFAAEMETLAQLRYCTEPEQKEGLALAGKPTRSTKEENRLKELMASADKIENEINALSQKMNPNATETKRLQDLQSKRTAAIRGLAKAEADRRDQIARMESQLMTEVENELLALVEKVAKDQKLPVIYERRAVLFGGNDLTDLVLKRLPK